MKQQDTTNRRVIISNNSSSSNSNNSNNDHPSSRLHKLLNIRRCFESSIDGDERRSTHSSLAAMSMPSLISHSSLESGASSTSSSSSASNNSNGMDGMDGMDGMNDVDAGSTTSNDNKQIVKQIKQIKTKKKKKKKKNNSIDRDNHKVRSSSKAAAAAAARKRRSSSSTNTTQPVSAEFSVAPKGVLPVLPVLPVLLPTNNNKSDLSRSLHESNPINSKHDNNNDTTNNNRDSFLFNGLSASADYFPKFSWHDAGEDVHVHVHNAVDTTATHGNNNNNNNNTNDDSIRSTTRSTLKTTSRRRSSSAKYFIVKEEPSLDHFVPPHARNHFVASKKNANKNTAVIMVSKNSNGNNTTTNVSPNQRMACTLLSPKQRDTITPSLSSPTLSTITNNTTKTFQPSKNMRPPSHNSPDPKFTNVKKFKIKRASVLSPTASTATDPKVIPSSSSFPSAPPFVNNNKTKRSSKSSSPRASRKTKQDPTSSKRSSRRSRSAEQRQQQRCHSNQQQEGHMPLATTTTAPPRRRTRSAPKSIFDYAHVQKLSSSPKNTKPKKTLLPAAAINADEERSVRRSKRTSSRERTSSASDKTKRSISAERKSNARSPRSRRPSKDKKRRSRSLQEMPRNTESLNKDNRNRSYGCLLGKKKTVEPDSTQNLKWRKKLDPPALAETRNIQPILKASPRIRKDGTFHLVSPNRLKKGKLAASKRRSQVLDSLDKLLFDKGTILKEGDTLEFTGHGVVQKDDGGNHRLVFNLVSEILPNKDSNNNK